MTLWLVRHAVTLAASDTCYGRLDVAAEPSSTGIAAQALAAALPRGVKVLSSPASRCRLLAAELARHRPDLAAAACDDRLQEMDFGAWEGQAWSAIGEAALTRWTDDFAGHAPGGGESVQALLDRVASALHEARGQERPTVWITHAGVVRAARLLARGVVRVDAADQWPREEVPFGGWETLPLR